MEPPALTSTSYFEQPGRDDPRYFGGDLVASNAGEAGNRGVPDLSDVAAAVRE
jgi:hypothetical protein